MLSVKTTALLAALAVAISIGLTIWPQDTTLNLIVAGCFAVYALFLAYICRGNQLMNVWDGLTLLAIALTLIFGAATMDDHWQTGSVVTLWTSCASVIFASIPNKTERLSSR